MPKKNFWITFCLFNLIIVALLGFTLRTKFLFPLEFLDYKNFLSAHSHFAFGGWVTLALMVLYIDAVLPTHLSRSRFYQFILWGILITSWGMVISFPFKGYAFFSILFSTLFIFFTYGFSWKFIKDIKRSGADPAVRIFSIGALVALCVSSIEPFSLAYMMANNKGSAILFNNAVYTYLHFQYNGFFTFSVFALLLNKLLKNSSPEVKKTAKYFSVALCLSLLPSAFPTLILPAHIYYIDVLSILSCPLLIIALVYFFKMAKQMNIYDFSVSQVAKVLLLLSMVSFIIKTVLQVAIIAPVVKDTVFGYRPVIIGFLHLVFLGLVSFYILSHFIEDNMLPVGKSFFVRMAVIVFAGAVIFNETVLLIQGVGLMLQTPGSIFALLLWFAAIFLVAGAVLLFIASLKSLELKGVDNSQS